MKSLMQTQPPEKQTSLSAAVDMPTYPYGTRIQLEAEQVKLFPELKGAAVGTELVLLAKVRVIGVNESEYQSEDGKKNKQHTVELQITEMEFEGKTDDAAKAGHIYQGQDSAPISRADYQP